MFCPRCRCEYVKGVTKCPDCKIPLVEELKDGEVKTTDEEYIEFCSVLKTANLSVIAVAKSILMGAGINYYVNGECVSSLYGFGSGGFNPLGVEIMVSKADEIAAKDLLSDLMK